MIRKLPAQRILVLGVLIILLVAACAPTATPETSSDSSNSSESTAPEAETATKTLRIAGPFLSTPPEPVLGSGWYAIQWGAGETLMRLDDEFTPIPWLAEELTQIDDLTWEIKLRPNVTFHDGTSVDAEAVKASLTRAIENNATAAMLIDAQEITVVDELTLIITTNTPNLRMPGVLTEPTTLIVNAAAATEQGDEQFGSKPIMTGPFMFEEVVIGQSASLRRNEDYWNGAAAVGAIEVAILADTDARMLALQSGEVDIAVDIPPESVAVAEADENLAVVQAKPVATIFMYINQNKTKWQDSNLRQALALATPNRDTLVKSVLRDQGVAGVGPFSPAVLACENLESHALDLSQARQLLAEAGYSDSDGDGIVEKDGETLTLLALTYPQRAPLTPSAEIVQANLQEIGIKMEIRSVEDINAALTEPDWDLGFYFNNMASTGDPYGSLSNFYTADGAANRGGYQNEAVEAAIAEMRDIADLGERRAKACEISQVILDDVAIVPLFYPFYSYGVSTQVSGFDQAPAFFLYFVTPEMSVQ